MPDRLDPHSAALFALVAVSLVIIGAVLTAGALGVEQRGSVLAAAVGVIAGVAFYAKRNRAP